MECAEKDPLYRNSERPGEQYVPAWKDRRFNLVSGLGTASLAANVVGNNIANFAILPGMSFGFALLTVCAQCVGAGDFEQVKYYTKHMMRVEYLCLIASNLIVILVLPFILSVYNLSDEAAQYANDIILYHAACVVTILAAVLHAAEYAARRGGCEGHHGALHHLHVGVPVWFQLPADHGVPYGNLRCLGCYDHRLACARNLLRLQVQERAVAEDYFLIKRMCLL